MASVDAAVSSGDFRHLDQLIGLCVTRRWIDQRRRHAHRARLHGGLHDGFHAREFFASRRSRRVAKDGDTRLRLRKVGPEVEADAVLLKAREVLADLLCRDWRSAFAADGGGDAHQQLVFSRAVLRQYVPGLIHHVNPPGRDVFAARVNLPPPSASNSANTDKATVFDRDIRQNPRIACAIKHSAVAYHDVKYGFAVLRCDWNARDAQCEQANERRGKCATEIIHDLFVFFYCRFPIGELKALTIAIDGLFNFASPNCRSDWIPFKSAIGDRHLANHFVSTTGTAMYDAY